MESAITTLERKHFCERLTTALKAADYIASPALLTREFNLRAGSVTISVHAARKWLSGAAFPTHERLHILARWLNVSPQWLRYGEGPTTAVYPANVSAALPHHEGLLLSDFRQLDRRSQLIVHDLIKALLKHYLVN